MTNNIEDLLLELKDKFISEKDSHLESIKGRIVTLDEYVLKLDDLVSKINKISDKYHSEITILVAEKDSLYPTIADLNNKIELLKGEVFGLETKRDEVIAIHKASISTFNDEQERMNRKLDGLFVEHKSLEASVSNLRGLESAWERKIRFLTDQEKGLADKISAQQEALGKLVQELELKAKQK